MVQYHGLYPAYEDQVSDSTLPKKPYKKDQKSWRIALAALGITLLVMSAITIPVIILFVYMYVWHATKREGMMLSTGADPTNLLGIIAFITKATEQGTVLVMSLMATIAASLWWRASKSNLQDQRPTGVQLGLAMDVLGAANIFAVFDGLAFAFGRKKASPHRSIRMPSFLRASIAVLAWLLVLHFIIAGLDQALHYTTKPATVIEKRYRSINSAGFYKNLNVNLSSAIPYENSVEGVQFEFSRPFNESRCEEYRQDDSIFLRFRDSCGLGSYSNNIGYIATPEMLMTLSNSSADNSVVWASDGTALMVPSSTINVSYTARALGIKSQCASITSQCVHCSYKSDYNTTTCDTMPSSSEAYLDFNCPTLNTSGVTIESGLPSRYVQGIIDPQTNAPYQYNNISYSAQYAQSNPFRFAFVSESFAYAGASSILGATNGTRGFVGDTGFIIWGHQGGINVIDCNVTVLDTEYSYVPPAQYKILQSTPATVNVTNIVSINQPEADRLTQQIEGAGMRAGPGLLSFADMAGLQLSKQYLAWSSILVDKQNTVSVEGFRVNGATIRLPLLGAYLALTLLYLLTVFIVGLISIVAASCGGGEGQSVIKARLLKPYHSLADAYGRRTTDPKHSLTRDGFRAFDPQHDADRLNATEEYDENKRIWQISIARIGLEEHVPPSHTLNYREEIYK